MSTGEADHKRSPRVGGGFSSFYFLRLCLLALSRLRYLCLLIFLRRFFMTEPIRVFLVYKVGVLQR